MVVARGFTIREARPAEFEAIADLVVEAYDALDEADDSYLPELRDVAGRAEQVPVLAAVDDATGRVLGSVTYVPGPGPWHEGELGPAASFRMLAVVADAQGRGIGRALVEHCIELARAAGRPAIAIHTRPSMTVAHQLYERLGFRRATELDWEFEPGEWLWAYRMELP